MSIFATKPDSGRPITAATALPGRADPIAISGVHAVSGASMVPPWPAGAELIYLAMGCFWGTERIFWRQPGVLTTAAGYMGGFTSNPSYEQVCTGRTGHAETVLVCFDPGQVSVGELLAVFWQNHDSTTLNRQGNDVGTQYRSAVFCSTAEQYAVARAAKQAFAEVLTAAGRPAPTTEIVPLGNGGPFYYAEEYHQQYLHKNPNGYCNHGPNGLACPVIRADALPSAG